MPVGRTTWHVVHRLLQRAADLKQRSHLETLGSPRKRTAGSIGHLVAAVNLLSPHPHSDADQLSSTPRHAEAEKVSGWHSQLEVEGFSSLIDTYWHCLVGDNFDDEQGCDFETYCKLHERIVVALALDIPPEQRRVIAR
eukprot:SAG11_NODE_7321_length_1160_cov_2.295005_2_plen_139_part_00